MKTYRVILQLRSALGTPLVSDTLFGHLCWGIVYHEGEDALQSFLNEFKAETPPLVISDPLPVGHWPMPVLPGPPPAVEDTLLEALDPSDPLQAHDRYKTLSLRAWVPHTMWAKLAYALDSSSIVSALADQGDPAPLALAMGSVAHNTINRLTSQTLEETGFFFDEQAFPLEPVDYDVWVRTTADEARLRDLFEWGLEGGYGRDASTGKGHLTVERVEAAELPTVETPNAVMTLGSCAPAVSDPTEGFWKIDVRHGKLGGPLSHLDDDTPFKQPVIFLSCGAVLATDRNPPVVGRLVRDVHPTRPEVVTSGWTLTLPVQLTKEAMPCPLTA